ncbi:ankyrin repeat domain-containing protein [Candidatus Berkiella aquae]|uniref:Ankyrin repeat domain-containing protein n=1 Tax=Candidatus Berkiella aquae TaxID=295108 RepID=A0A0Q9YNZ1_9GAMM|nr:ankyrin repeat domain-containing protein [Candidatus Berkiella aquae]MCS5712109.1 ankyrin repeat domain-containing protein [Candidatus Berkiella aquae]
MLRSNKFYPKLSTIPDVEKPSTPSKASGANKLSDLHWAVLENDIDAVKKILSKNSEAINKKNAHGSTAL